LVNASRVPIVETEALVEALSERKIRAALDVTNPEPLPEGHPWWKAPNLLITPHGAGDSARFIAACIPINLDPRAGKVYAGRGTDQHGERRTLN
jgi:phosphoglycerate dehydrogenase-like enzyme